ncbi:MAG TPA: hypothetical protein VKE98_17825 [Gemmataceae bacterium]|nr:hypothetical protein [Gemmataceae bacterium]
MATLFTCLLVFLGSGDDINIARLFFPGAAAEAGGLPLDDPNTDLVESSGDSATLRKFTSHVSLLPQTTISSPGTCRMTSPPEYLLPIPSSAKPFPLRC